jgi:S-DNA-T family DNA segregation ATPase FtsK/SpoIIIE
VLGERRREVACILAMFCTAFAVAALVGWNPNDPTWIRPDVRGTAITNPCGPLGANVADVLYRSVGWGAWAVLVGFVVPVFVLARRSLLTLGQAMLVAWLYVMTLALLDLGLAVPGEAFPAGGRLGAVVTASLVNVVGSFGAWLVLLAAFTSAASLLLQVSWSRVAAAIMGRLDAGLPVVQERARAAGGTVGAWLQALGAFVWSTFVAAVSALWRALVALASRVARSVQAALAGAAASLRGASTRMWHALTRTEEPWEEDEWEQLSGLDPLDASDADVEAFATGEGTATMGAGATTSSGWTPTSADATAELLDLFPAFTPRRQPVLAAAGGGGASVEMYDEAVGTSWSSPTSPSVVRAPEPVAEVSLPQARRPIRETIVPDDRPMPAPVAVVSFEPPVVEPSVVEQPPAEPVSREPVAPVVTKAPPVVDPSFVDEVSSVVEPPSVVEVPAMEAPIRPAMPSPRSVAPVAPRPRDVGIGPQVEKAAGLESRAVDDGGAVSDSGDLYFELPALSLLDTVPTQRATIDEAELKALAETVRESLASFRVTGEVTNVRVGPVVTTFEFLPDAGISVRKISGLADDLAMALRALSVRVVAPIPGKGVVGIEIPSRNRLTIYLREMLASPEFRKSDAALPVVLGKDVEGRPIVANLAKMPHLLVGGTTGSGKSVGVNGMLMSLLFTRTPEELRLLLVDPKILEFEAYADVPHLLHPVVTEPDKAAAALAWACIEMDRRYQLMARWKTRNISSFNKKVERESRSWSRDKALRYAPRGYTEADGPLPQPETLPYIVIVIDELADLMMTAKKDVQESIVRIAQKARACGMHLIIATQRPSVDVVTGLIKSNLPTRIAFKLRSVVDSRTILDQGGAEKLLGMGDMLYLPGAGDAVRCHGAFVSDDEVGRVIEFLRDQRGPDYLDDITKIPDEGNGAGELSPEDEDELYDDAVNFVIDSNKCSTSMIQRKFKIGYNRAARIVDAMEAMGVVGPTDGARPREVLAGRNSG